MTRTARPSRPYREAVEGWLAGTGASGRLVPQGVDAFRLLRRVDPRASFVVWSVQAASAAGIAAHVVLTEVGPGRPVGRALVSAVLPPLLLIVVVDVSAIGRTTKATFDRRNWSRGSIAFGAVVDVEAVCRRHRHRHRHRHRARSSGCLTGAPLLAAESDAGAQTAPP